MGRDWAQAQAQALQRWDRLRRSCTRFQHGGRGTRGVIDPEENIKRTKESGIKAYLEPRSASEIRLCTTGKEGFSPDSRDVIPVFK